MPANFKLSHKSKVSASIKRSTFSSRWRHTERWPDFRVNLEQPWIRSYFCHQAECGFGRLTQTPEEINEQNYDLILQPEGGGQRHEEKRRLRRETEAKSLETLPPKAADSGRHLTWAASTSRPPVPRALPIKSGEPTEVAAVTLNTLNTTIKEKKAPEKHKKDQHSCLPV